MTEVPIEDRIRMVATKEEADELDRELGSLWWTAVMEGDVPEKNRLTALQDDLRATTRHMVYAKASKPTPPARGGSLEKTTLVGGQTLTAHTIGSCAGYWCCIHRPSPHHMTTWNQEWENSHMYRICEHGHSHPDPDDFVNYDTLAALAAHKAYCDGCCINPYFDKDLL